jgi:hypothetical protein
MSDYYAERTAKARAMYPRGSQSLKQGTETKGTLHYWNGLDVVSIPGWFRIAEDGHTVVARKNRGTWVWRLTDVDNVRAFYSGA